MFSYTTLLVLSGTSVLGFISGVVGAFMLLRRRALLGDVISHATLPGIALSIIFLGSGAGEAFREYKFEIVFISGAVSGAVGLLFLRIIRAYTHLKEDVALALTLSVFFGFGIAVLGVLQQIGGMYASGVEAYLYGKATSLTRKDLVVSLWLSALVVISIILLYRPLLLISFDASYAKIKGYSLFWYDLALFVLILAVCMLGLQAVGIILMLALLVIPAASMRFWTKSFSQVIWGAGIFGAMGAATGSFISARFESVPSGPSIVLSLVFFFICSVLFGSVRGFLWGWFSEYAFSKRIMDEHLLRFWFEALEKLSSDEISKLDVREVPMTIEELMEFQAFANKKTLLKALRKLQKGDYVVALSNDRYCLSKKGYLEAEKLVHQHRLWELFLLEYADIAPSMVDRGADRIEHVLEPHIVRELERLLSENKEKARVLKSPHPI
jgi:manganese/zinc/iron transport system permease protein